MCNKIQYKVPPFRFKYKPGQLVTINGRLYRIKKYLPNDHDTLKCECCMEDCDKARSKLICAYFTEILNKKVCAPSCHFKLIQRGLGRYLELVSK